MGTGCGLFHVEKIADEYFLFLEKCKEPRACSVILRGASKDILNEIERDLQDALCVAKNAIINPFLVPGGGATEMAISVQLSQESRKLASSDNSLSSFITPPYSSVGDALEVIPRTLISNCGGDVIRTMTSLRAKHAEGFHMWGVNGVTGKLMDMSQGADSNGVWEPLSVKLQTLKTAVEVG